MINGFRMMKRYFLHLLPIFVATVCVAELTGCNAFMPVGVSADVAPRGISIDGFPEHFVYRIDEHRYLTIQGNDDCAGRIFFNDTQAGIRTLVATTGIAVGSGKFRGYYAAQSPYIAIPAIGYSEISGPLLYIYYSHDGGTNFKRVLVGADLGDQSVVIVEGKNLYVGQNDSDASRGLFQARVIDISRDIPIGDDEFAIRSERPSVKPSKVPTNLKSPSGETKWTCSALSHD